MRLVKLGNFAGNGFPACGILAALVLGETAPTFAACLADIDAAANSLTCQYSPDVTAQAQCICNSLANKSCGMYLDEYYASLPLAFPASAYPSCYMNQTSISLTATPSTVVAGSTTRLRAVLTRDPNWSAGTPTGQIDFRINGALVAANTALNGPNAVLNPSNVTVTVNVTLNDASSNKTITASYAGDTKNTASSNAANPTTVTMTKAATSVSLACNTPVVVQGQPASFTATITGGPQPSGTSNLTVKVGSVTLPPNESVTSYTVNLTRQLAAPGAQSLVADFLGDTNHLPATSAALLVTVAPASTTIPELPQLAFYALGLGLAGLGWFRRWV